MTRRATRQRETVLMTLRRMRSHPTADQIYQEVRKRIPNISKGTVYRNLKVLNDEGLISELSLNGTIRRYEAGQGDHYHFRCELCGRVSDVDYPVDRELNSRVASPTGLKISSHQLEFRGTCQHCQGRGEWRK